VDVPSVSASSGDAHQPGPMAQLDFATEATRQYVDLDRHAHIVEVLGGSEVTAYSPDAYGELRDAILHAYVDDRVDSVAIRCHGSFAGGDLKDFLSRMEGEPSKVILEADHVYARMPFRAALRCPKTVVTTIDGLCLGGALAMALVSDVVIATTRSVFAAPEARAGMFEPYVMEFLVPVVGLTRARHLVATGEFIDAEKAERWGIVTTLADDAEDLERHLATALGRISRGSPTARAMYKRGMTARIPDTDVLDNFRVAMGTNGLEGLRAFRDKRAPQWRPLDGDGLH
jgi:2-oxoglutaroyl-CoA hydrolase